MAVNGGIGEIAFDANERNVSSHFGSCETHGRQKGTWFSKKITSNSVGEMLLIERICFREEV